MVSQNDPAALLARFEQHMVSTGYTRPVVTHLLYCTQQFLRYITERQISLGALESSHLSDHLRDEIRRFRRRRGRSPVSTPRWRQCQARGIRTFLRLVLGKWPPTPTAADPYEAHCRQLCDEYAEELRDRSSLVSCTVAGRMAEARRFLAWVKTHGSPPGLATLSVSDIDCYLKTRTATIQRTTRKTVSLHLRSFLRFLHGSGHIGCDLAASVIAPTLYRFEATPSVLTPEQVRTILTTASNDGSPAGLRNYAILLLLTTYGLRAGEVTHLRLEDVDWRGERIWICHRKTGARSCLPLLPQPGQALLKYLQRGRPKCVAREIFIRSYAPRCGLFTSSALNSMLRRHLAKIGLRVIGKHGPHVFRHSRAVSLLRAGVPVKTIGDVLGHRSAASVNAYLKLDDQELRLVALAIPTAEVES